MCERFQWPETNSIPSGVSGGIPDGLRAVLTINPNMSEITQVIIITTVFFTSVSFSDEYPGSLRDLAETVLGLLDRPLPAGDGSPHAVGSLPIIYLAVRLPDPRVLGHFLHKARKWAEGTCT